MNRQRLIIFLLLAVMFIGATALYFAGAWRESQTRYRAGLPIPRDLIPEELLTDEERIPDGPPQAPEVRPEDPLISGNPASPLTVILVSDFQCDVCADQAQALIDAIRLTGRPQDVRVVWRDFPIVSEHSKALAMSVIGRCAAAQGRFREMFNLLSFETKEYTEEEFTRFARRINLDEQEFSVCIRDPAQSFYITQDMEAERMLGIKEVPTMFVGESPIVGFVDADSLTAILRRELGRIVN